MFIFINFIFASNQRSLSIMGHRGFIIGKVDSYASIISSKEYADVFEYIPLKKNHKFAIHVANTPGVFWSIDDDNSLVYKYNPTPSKESVFEIRQGELKNEFRILHKGKCLTLNLILDRFYTQECFDNDALQTWIPKDKESGEEKRDSLPILKKKRPSLVKELF